MCANVHLCVCICVCALSAFTHDCVRVCCVSAAHVYSLCVCVSVMKIDKMKEKQVVSSWSFLVSLSHHGNRLLPPSCTPVYLVYSSPIHPSLPPTLFWLPSLLHFESCTPLYLLHSLHPSSSKSVVIFFSS